MPAKYLGYVDAVDEKTAREQAAKEFKISEALRNRFAVQREGHPEARLGIGLSALKALGCGRTQYSVTLKGIVEPIELPHFFPKCGKIVSYHCNVPMVEK